MTDMKKFNFKNTQVSKMLSKIFDAIRGFAPYEEYSIVVFFLLHLRRINLIQETSYEVLTQKIEFDKFVNKNNLDTELYNSFFDVINGTHFMSEAKHSLESFSSIIDYCEKMDQSELDNYYPEIFDTIIEESTSFQSKYNFQKDAEIKMPTEIIEYTILGLQGRKAAPQGARANACMLKVPRK